MKKWQEVIINKFNDKYTHSVVVIDKDNLMQDDYLISNLQQQDYDIINFSKEVVFRNEFEERYRSKWDQGLKTQIVVIVQSQSEVADLPYDVVVKSEEITISLTDVFPRLNYLVTKHLDKGYYQKLFDAHKRIVEDNKDYHLSVKDTTSFILRSVFNLDSIAIDSNEKLIGLLIEKHYANMSIPEEIQEHIINELTGKISINVNLSKAMGDTKYFYTWLQEQWYQYVTSILSKESAQGLLDFTNQDIYLNIDNMFLEGKIKKYVLQKGQQAAFENLESSEQWISVGIDLPCNFTKTAKESNTVDMYALRTRLSRFNNIEDELNLRQWLDLGYEFAQVVHTFTMLPKDKFEDVKAEFIKIRESLNNSFISFLKLSYSSISFFDDNKGPISLAKVNHYINKKRADKERVALLVFDGMSVDQWLLVREYLKGKLEVSFKENKSYAIAPTITSVSRQSLFSGRLPSHFTDSLYTTAKEEQRWITFWKNKDVRPKRINYLRVNITDEFDKVKEVADSKNEILGVVINFIDDLMHAVKDVKAGKRFFYDTINSYLDNSNLDNLFNILLNAGYKIYITSDHGNIDGVGNGVKSPKDLIEIYAKRTIIFDREELANNFAEEYKQDVFRPTYTPENFYPVYPLADGLFTTDGINEISHGGLSLEEMIVPFVEVVNE